VTQQLVQHSSESEHSTCVEVSESVLLYLYCCSSCMIKVHDELAEGRRGAGHHDARYLRY
jgi:hypothetical protein